MPAWRRPAAAYVPTAPPGTGSGGRDQGGEDMADQELRTLVAQGLQALRAGGEVARRATAEIENDVRDSELKAALQVGNQAAEQWKQRVDRAVEEAGPAEDTGNPVLEAHYQTSRLIRQKAPDELTRDLGIIAAGQLALHYWIAAFGTLRTYASALGMDGVARDMQACLDEAKQADQQHTDIAQRLLGAQV